MTRPSHVTPAEISKLMDFAARTGPWVMPLLTALREGKIGIVMLGRTERAPLADMRRSALPVLAWVGDDDYLSCGPDGWRPARAVAQWAKGGIVHAAAGEAHHYQTAVNGTIEEGRFLLVETNSHYATAWSALLLNKPVLHILPRGGVHPIYPETKH